MSNQSMRPPDDRSTSAARMLPSAADKLTTIFVGSIADGVSDTWIERILRICGPIRSWKRMTDPSGKPKAFGFCVYENAEAVSRALRVLNGEGRFMDGVELPSPSGGPPKKLKLNVDETARKHLEHYRSTRANGSDEIRDKETYEEVSSLVRRLRENGTEVDVDSLISSAVADAAIIRPGSPTPSSAKDDMDDLPADMPPEQREVISREIQMFRERSAAKDREKKEAEERARDYREQAGRRKDDRARPMRYGESPVPHGNFPAYFTERRASSRGVEDADEDEEELRQKRRQEEAQLAFLERQKRFEYEEKKRIQWLQDTLLGKEDDARHLAEREQELKQKLAEWDEDQHLTDEDKRAYLARSYRNRRKEIDYDQMDRAEEERELSRMEITESASEETEESAKPQEVVVTRIMTKEERTQAIQDLIGIIPTDKEGLWKWSIKWDVLDDSITSNKLRPWINKKVTEYMGAEEPDLVDFVISFVEKRTSAQQLLEELQPALDEDAESFVIMLWRMLIYETEARFQGLG
ncbi:hypothetical protein BC832DRAFT_588428 [Gaertneriomyces semiglobifer]|nr:hypothetical protein BC832DRAFT_588428 [Gaertneriomyces semiglobifer]